MEKVQQYPEDSHWFYDIYILIESVENMEHLEKIKKLNDKYKASLLKKAKKGVEVSKGKEEFVKFDDIKDSLTGYGRIISYKASNSNPDP